MDLLRSVQLLLQVEHVSSECPAACGRGSDQFLSLIVRHLLRISRLEVKFQGLWLFVGHLRLRVLVLQLCQALQTPASKDCHSALWCHRNSAWHWPSQRPRRATDGKS